MKKKNNKGFSLIELIIAIAILVILTGLLAPQFMRYMEKSRESKDMQTLDAIYSAAQTALADEAAYDEVKDQIGTHATPPAGADHTLDAMVTTGMTLDDILDTANTTAFADEMRATLNTVNPDNVWSSKSVTEAGGSENTFVMINRTNLQVSVWVGVAAGADQTLAAANVLGDALPGHTTAGVTFRIVK